MSAALELGAVARLAEAHSASLKLLSLHNGRQFLGLHQAIRHEGFALTPRLRKQLAREETSLLFARHITRPSIDRLLDDLRREIMAGSGPGVPPRCAVASQTALEIPPQYNVIAV